MTKEGFVKLIENAQNYSKELDRWSDFGIDLFELPISELGWGFLNTVLPELFSDEGVDWVNWWLFEKPGLFKNSLPNEAYDEDGNIIPTDTIDDLWNLVKDYQKMTLEELKKKVVTITVHKNIVLGEDLQEEWLKKYIEEEFVSDEELLKTLIENEYDYSGLDDVLDYDDYKVTIHD